MVKIDELLKAPLQDKQWPSKIAIGGVVSVIPILSFCGMGYIISLIKSAMKKKEEVLPEWSNWGKLFSDGIICFVISFVYTLIPMLIFAIGAVVSGGGVFGWAFKAFVTFISAISLLGVYFILPMAICHYAATDDMKSAFAWKVIQEKIKATSKDYGIAYLLTIGFFIAGYIVTFLLGMVIIGWILMPFLFFYLHLIFARMFGGIYPVEPVESAPIEEEKTG